MASAIRCSNKSRELYEESVPLLSNFLQSRSKILKAAGSLATVTFFCADHSEETETSMQILWHLSNSWIIMLLITHGFHCQTCWWDTGMVLSSINLERMANLCEHWKGAVSYLSSLLVVDKEMLRVTAAEALYLIAETASVAKFADETTGSTTSPSILTTNETPDRKLKDNIRQMGQSRVPNAVYCTELTKGIFHKKVSSLRKRDREYVNLVRVDAAISGCREFLSYIQNNKLLRNVFEFVEKRKQPSMNEISKPENDEVIKRYFIPVIKPRGGRADTDLLPFKSEKETAMH